MEIDGQVIGREIRESNKNLVTYPIQDGLGLRNPRPGIFFPYYLNSLSQLKNTTMIAILKKSIKCRNLILVINGRISDQLAY